MPLELPNLDDRTYADLVEEALAMIPAHAPEWTNHNPSDPGITLVELFAYLTEMMVYRLNRVTDANKLAFLYLLTGSNPGWQNVGDTRDPSEIPDLFRPEARWHYNANQTLDQNIREVMFRLRDEQRAVTVMDFERLACQYDNGTFKVARAFCLPRRNLETNQDQTTEGHISVVIITIASDASAFKPSKPLRPDKHFLAEVKTYLQARCLLATRLHVCEPCYLKVAIQVTIGIYTDALEPKVREDVLAALTNYYHPLPDDNGRGGWPLGRNVYVSDIYALLDQLPGVDYVENLQLLVDDSNPRTLLEGNIGIALRQNEFLEFQREKSNITINRNKHNKRNR